MLSHFKKLLKPYIMRLRIESALKCSAAALVSGLVVAAAIILYTKLMQDRTEYILALIAGCTISLLGGILLYFIRYKPDLKDTTARIDELGLEERISTMLALADDETVISDIQRKDALEKLNRTEPKQIKIRLPLRQLITCLIVMVFIGGIALIPYSNVFAEDAMTELSEEENQIISELIEALREKVAEVDVDDDTRARLNEVIDELEEDIKKCDTYVEKIARISEASDKISDILEELLTKNIIGAALTEYDCTEELGKAIIDGDTDAVVEILEGMKDELNGLANEEYLTKLNEIINSINGALALSESAGVDSEDDLFSAIKTLGDKLTDAEADAEQGEDVSDRVDKAIDEAEDAITSALEKQNQIEKAASEIQDLLDNAKDDISSLEQGEDSETSGEGSETSGEGSEPSGEGSQTSGEGSKPSGEGSEPSGEGSEPSGESSGMGGEGSQTGGGTSGENNSSDTETIYDSSDGAVPYDEVYNSYYADALSEIDGSDIPEGTQDSINEYFDSLG